jgi:hypothetical protein
MERVKFITVEAEDDLILSFVVQSPDDPSAIESLILLRTPKFEYILGEHERGVNVCFERHGEDGFLQKLDYLEADAIVRIQTSTHEYELDVREVEEDELKQMCGILRRMNFDLNFQTTGV